MTLTRRCVSINPSNSPFTGFLADLRIGFFFSFFLFPFVSTVDPDRGRPVGSGDTDMLAAPAVEPYTYNQPNNEMAEANGYSSRPVSGAFSYNGPGSPNAGYSPVPAGAAGGAAALGAAVGGASAYGGSSAGGPNQSSSGGMSRGPSTASSYSNGSSSAAAGLGLAGAGAGAGAGMSAAAAKRQEAQRERNRLHANGPSDVPEEDQPRSGDNVVVHEDGGSVPNEQDDGDRVELPPVYGGWQSVSRCRRRIPSCSSY